MSKQVGLIKLKGNIGGISFYKSGGDDLARTASGPSKERIATDSAFVRTRENNQEFGGSASVGKSLRLAFATSVQTMADKRFTSRLTKLFKEINVRGTGVRGQRPITISGSRTMLENLEFNEKISFSSVFNAPFTFAANTGRTQGTITIANFLPSAFIQAPAGATHFQLISVLGVISDFTYNTTTGKYEPTDPTLNLLGGNAASAVTALNSAAAVNFSLVAALSGTPTMTATVSGVQCLGIQFFQRVGTTDYLLAQGNAMKIIKVF